MKRPLISIISVVYNAEKYLEKHIQSIIQQEYEHIEYLIIDGESTDNTLSIIENYSASIDYWISEPDQGIYDAMNKGIQASKGDWLYFIGADDLLNKNAFSGLVSALENPENLMVYGNIYNVFDQKIIGQPYTLTQLTKPGQRIAHQSAIYHKSLFQELGHYEIGYSIVADHVFHLNCFAKYSTKIQYIDHVICNYSGSGVSSNNVVDLNYYNSFDTILRKIETYLQTNQVSTKRIVENFQLLQAEREILLGNFAKGILSSLYYSVLRVDPLIFLVALGKLKRRITRSMTIV